MRVVDGEIQVEGSGKFVKRELPKQGIA
jgi:hypothetical protein